MAVGRIIELVNKRIPKRFGLDPIRDIQVQAVSGETDQPGDQAAPGLPTTWDDIAVGHLVLAPEEGANQGGWEAIVLARDGDMLTLKWRDWRLVADSQGALIEKSKICSNI